MRTKCANCQMIYDIPVTSMDLRTQSEILASGKCPKCGSNAHDTIPTKWESNISPNSKSIK